MPRGNTPRRKRAEMKAWVYLALFGRGEEAEEAEEATDGFASGAAGDGDATDERRREE